MRKPDLTTIDTRVLGAAILLTAALATWSAIAVQYWLFTLVLVAVGIADLPLVERVRARRSTTVALLTHAGVLVVGWFVAFLASAPFLYWE